MTMSVQQARPFEGGSAVSAHVRAVTRPIFECRCRVQMGGAGVAILEGLGYPLMRHSEALILSRVFG